MDLTLLRRPIMWNCRFRDELNRVGPVCSRRRCSDRMISLVTGWFRGEWCDVILRRRVSNCQTFHRHGPGQPSPRRDEREEDCYPWKWVAHFNVIKKIFVLSDRKPIVLSIDQLWDCQVRTGFLRLASWETSVAKHRIQAVTLFLASEMTQSNDWRFRLNSSQVTQFLLFFTNSLWTFWDCRTTNLTQLYYLSRREHNSLVVETPPWHDKVVLWVDELHKFPIWVWTVVLS